MNASTITTTDSITLLDCVKLFISVIIPVLLVSPFHNTAVNLVFVALLFLLQQATAPVIHPYLLLAIATTL